MKKISLFVILSCMVFAVDADSLAQMIKNIDLNVTTKEHKVSNPHRGEVNNNPYYQGEVVTVEQAGAYTYLEVKEKTEKTFWVAVNSADVKVGDYVRFQKELVTKNFKSKALKRTFEELMFASGLQYRVAKDTNTTNEIKK